MGLDPGCGTEFLLAAQAVLCDGRFGVEDCGRLSAALGSLTLERVSRLPSLLTRRSLGLLGEVGEAGDFGFLGDGGSSELASIVSEEEGQCYITRGELHGIHVYSCSQYISVVFCSRHLETLRHAVHIATELTNTVTDTHTHTEIHTHTQTMRHTHTQTLKHTHTERHTH